MPKLLLYLLFIAFLALSIASCSRHVVGGHHAGGDLTRTYHDGHLGK